jgi:hypothetical protein
VRDHPRIVGNLVAHVRELPAQRRHKFARIALGIAGLAAIDHERAEVAKMHDKAIG